MYIVNYIHYRSNMATINIEKSVTSIHPLTDTQWHHIDLKKIVSLLQTDLQNGL